MRLAQALRAAAQALQAAGIEDAPLEAEVLLRHALRLDRAHLYARLQQELSPGDEAAFRPLLARRLTHEPAAYIVGQREFYGLDLETTPAALIPRPETELLVEAALACAGRLNGDWCVPGGPPPASFGRDPNLNVGASEDRSMPPPSGGGEELPTNREPVWLKGPTAHRGPFLIVDVGTGNGAIAVALAVHLPRSRLVAIDVSREALALAGRNARRHGVETRITFLQADLLSPLACPMDVIVANLPYVRSDDWESLAPEIREHEPRVALDGGPNGLREIGRLLEQAPSRLRPGGSLFVELGPPQAAAALALARRCFPGATAHILPDAAGLDRVLAVDTPVL